jgi:hypothetical protein
MNNRSYKYFDLVVTRKFDLAPYHFRGWVQLESRFGAAAVRSGNWQSCSWKWPV